jgi:hypothetical protein
MPKIIADKIWAIKTDQKILELNINDMFYNFEKLDNKEDKAKYQKAKEMEEPAFIDKDKKRVLFGSWIFELTPYEASLSFEKRKLLLMECIDKERKKFERLKNKFSKDNKIQSTNTRTQISEKVRIYVWRRDGGKCVLCNSQEKLEYDHIIPVSKGGSNTERNIRLLCERCNREKGDKI